MPIAASANPCDDHARHFPSARIEVGAVSKCGPKRSTGNSRKPRGRNGWIAGHWTPRGEEAIVAVTNKSQNATPKSHLKIMGFGNYGWKLTYSVNVA
jgi:hypothetical protein